MKHRRGDKLAQSCTDPYWGGRRTPGTQPCCTSPFVSVAQGKGPQEVGAPELSVLQGKGGAWELPTLQAGPVLGPSGASLVRSGWPSWAGASQASFTATGPRDPVALGSKDINERGSSDWRPLLTEDFV